MFCSARLDASVPPWTANLGSYKVALVSNLEVETRLVNVSGVIHVYWGGLLLLSVIDVVDVNFLMECANRFR